PGRPDLEPAADHFNRHVVFQAWDMLAGRLLPELGGAPELLGALGINYYWMNQWELGRPGFLEDGDARQAPPQELIRSVWERYGRDVVITETTHVGDARAAWARSIALEAEALLDQGVPLQGICLYPILSMPEWHDRSQWARMGLWDLEP